MTGEATPFTPPAQPAPVEGAPVETPPAPTPAPALVVPESLQTLVGEGKKYATMELAIAGIAPAQAHIMTIEGENAELKTANEKSRSSEEMLAEWKESVNKQAAPAPVPLAQPPAVTPEALGEAVNQQMDVREAAAVAKTNTTNVIDAMVKEHGDAVKAEAEYIKRANEYGLGVAGLNALVAKSPKAAFRMLGLDTQVSPAPTPSRGSVNTETFNQSTPPAQAPKSIMAGASTAQVKAAWAAAKPAE